jgi:two-component system nitrogen regulation response regulator GlnG
MAEQNSIWVIDDDRSIRWVLEKALKQAGIAVQSFESGDAVLKQLQREEPMVLVTDIRMPGISGLELLEMWTRRSSWCAAPSPTARSRRPPPRQR